jgi:hypothetical protein
MMKRRIIKMETKTIELTSEELNILNYVLAVIAIEKYPNDEKLKKLHGKINEKIIKFEVEKEN